MYPPQIELKLIKGSGTWWWSKVVISHGARRVQSIRTLPAPLPSGATEPGAGRQARAGAVEVDDPRVHETSASLPNGISRFFHTTIVIGR